VTAGDIEVSSLCRWYREDFDRQRRAGKGLEGFLTDDAEVLGLDAQRSGRLARGELPGSFPDHDWRLKRVP